jgi:hypothetical protein
MSFRKASPYWFHEKIESFPARIFGARLVSKLDQSERFLLTLFSGAECPPIRSDTLTRKSIAFRFGFRLCLTWTLLFRSRTKLFAVKNRCYLTWPVGAFVLLGQDHLSFVRITSSRLRSCERSLVGRLSWDNGLQFKNQQLAQS